MAACERTDGAASRRGADPCRLFRPARRVGASLPERSGFPAPSCDPAELPWGHDGFQLDDDACGNHSGGVSTASTSRPGTSSTSLLISLPYERSGAAMTDMLSIGGARAAATGAHRRFRRLYAVVLALNCLIAVVAILFPDWAAAMIGIQPSVEANKLIRAVGGLMLVAALFQLPGLLDPVEGRITIIIGIIGRFGLALVFLCLGGGFLWLAALEGLLGVAILVTFQSLITAEIMTRP
jgi:hypothetical protein